MSVVLAVHNGNGSGTYGAMETVNISAYSITGYHFTNWGDATQLVFNGDPTSPTASVTLWSSGPAQITAFFAINTYTLTYTAGAHGSISGATPQYVQYGGNGSAVTAVPAAGYYFNSWSDGYGSATRTDTSVSANINVTANFSLTSALPVVTTVTPNTGRIAGGTTVQIYGSNFTGTYSVDFGGYVATASGIYSDTHIWATTPAHAAGYVDVDVYNASGVGWKSSGFRYTTTTNYTKSIAGILSFAGSVKRAITRTLGNNILSFAGSLTVNQGHANQKLLGGNVVTFSGNLYINKTRPISVQAPYVSTIGNIP